MADKHELLDSVAVCTGRTIYTEGNDKWLRFTPSQKIWHCCKVIES